MQLNKVAEELMTALLYYGNCGMFFKNSNDGGKLPTFGMDNMIFPKAGNKMLQMQQLQQGQHHFDLVEVSVTTQFWMRTRPNFLRSNRLHRRDARTTWYSDATSPG